MTLPSKKVLKAKVLIAIFTIGCIFVFKEFGLPNVEVKCIDDPSHDYFNDLNRRVNTDHSFANLLQISSSLLMDFIFLSLYVYWVLNVKTGRPIYAIGLFYLIRGLTQATVTLRYPEGYLWEDPGVPSLVVPYGRSSDFFFSGHCGFLNLCALEWLRNGKKGKFLLVQIANAYLAIVMLIFRIHYLVDIVAAIVFSHYILLFVEWHLEKIDSVFIGIYNLLSPSTSGSQKTSTKTDKKD